MAQQFQPDQSQPLMNYTMNEMNYSRDIPVEEIIKQENTFNRSVASLGDIYAGIGLKKENRDQNIIEKFKDVQIDNPLFKETFNISGPIDENEEYNDQVNQRTYTKGFKKSFTKGFTTGDLKKSQQKVHNVYLGSNAFKKGEYNVQDDPAFKQRKVEVNYLHNTPLKPSKKYSHVVMGKINPPKSTFSVKKIVDTAIEDHVKEMKPIVLYPSRVKIHNQEPERISPDRYKTMYNSSMQSAMVIGKGVGPKKPKQDSHVVFRPKKGSQYERRCISSKKARDTLNVSEKFFSSLDDYFKSSEMKIPSKDNINDIVKYAEKVEKSLNDFKEEELGIKTKGKFEDPFRKKLKEKKGLIKPKPPKTYPEIDETYKKNMQEKLSTLQIELRNIFDNITQIRDHKGDASKLNEMIEKAKELTHMITHLAKDVNEGEKKLKESTSKTKRKPASAKPKEYQPMTVNKSVNMQNSLMKGSSFNPIVEESKDSSFINQSTSIRPDAIIVTNINFQPQNTVSLEIVQKKLSTYIPKHNLILDQIDKSTIPKLQKQFDKEKLLPVNAITDVSFIGIKAPANTHNPNLSQTSFSQSNFMTSQAFPAANQNSMTQSFQGGMSQTLPNYLSQTINFQQNTGFPQNQTLSASRVSFAPSMSQTQFPNSQNQQFNQSQYPRELGKDTVSSFYPQQQFGQTTQSQTQFNQTTQSQLEPLFAYSRNNFNDTTQNNKSTNRGPNLLLQSQAVNDVSMTINQFRVSNPQDIKVDAKNNVILDDRFSAYNVEFPVKYYYEVSKDNEPPLDKDWYIRPHHIETFSQSPNAIPDDILNTKYISYYGPPDKANKEKTRQELIEELIKETRSHIDKLQYDMFEGTNDSKEKEKLYQKLEMAKKEALKNYKPGMIIDKDKGKKVDIVNVLQNENDHTSYSDMFNNNEDIQQTNLTIDVYKKLLAELREKEREILLVKRKEEYERIRPPLKNWYELKGEEFQREMQRNKMVINAGPEYFEKIRALQDEELY